MTAATACFATSRRSRYSVRRLAKRIPAARRASCAVSQSTPTGTAASLLASHHTPTTPVASWHGWQRNHRGRWGTGSAPIGPARWQEHGDGRQRDVRDTHRASYPLVTYGTVGTG